MPSPCRAAIVALLAAGYWLLAPFATAQVPSLINYQGRLLNATNLVNGSVALSLRLYDAPTLGTLLYEDSNTVTVADGLYATLIGDNTTFGALAAALTNAAVYIQVAVNGAPLSPRERLAAVGYAMTAGGLAATNLNVGALAVTTNNVGIRAGTPGEALHIEEGNILMNSPYEQEIRMRNSGITFNPTFKLGRIVTSGDGDPEFRILYQADDLTNEVSVFEFDEKGIIASVKRAHGSHFEGFIGGDSQPLFRLNSSPAMQLELGPGGTNATDIYLRRTATNTLGILGPGPVRVGIGTASPARELQVSGSVQAVRFYFSSNAWLQLDASGTNLLFIANSVTNQLNGQGVIN